MFRVDKKSDCKCSFNQNTEDVLFTVISTSGCLLEDLSKKKKSAVTSLRKLGWFRYVTEKKFDCAFYFIVEVGEQIKNS